MTVKHLNQQELAERWDCSAASLERWRCEGIGPVFMKLHGRVLYRIEDVEAYEAQCLRTSTSQPLTAGGAA
ncbi:helix-turn-helix domain-containing protein [Ferriphaselus sp. R-1]|uniref:helix-turn-helix transcriptional regulator n=1 Tax=Ferriphaselus sp. R-1 TaxID=1485544 RepID=UPI0009DEF240|nr:helix-turn-helix domain-containing protein [Ferriphaselus sp. R-1]